MITITLNDNKYQLSDKLRVAFKFQEVNNHKPYMQLFDGMADMPIEKQIQLIWVAFEMANPGTASFENPSKAMQWPEFRDYCLDNINLNDIMEIIQGIIEGIMYKGLSPDEIAKKKEARKQKAAEMNEE